jgi:translation initiation factor 3 subunit A
LLPQAAVLRLLKQLSEVYSSMHITEVARLVPFMSFGDVEAVVVDAVKYDYLQVRGAGGGGGVRCVETLCDMLLATAA